MGSSNSKRIGRISRPRDYMHRHSEYVGSLNTDLVLTPLTPVVEPLLLESTSKITNRLMGNPLFSSESKKTGISVEKEVNNFYPVYDDATSYASRNLFSWLPKSDVPTPNSLNMVIKQKDANASNMINSNVDDPKKSIGSEIKQNDNANTENFDFVQDLYPLCDSAATNTQRSLCSKVNSESTMNFNQNKRKNYNTKLHITNAKIGGTMNTDTEKLQDRGSSSKTTEKSASKCTPSRETYSQIFAADLSHTTHNKRAPQSLRPLKRDKNDLNSRTIKRDLYLQGITNGKSSRHFESLGIIRELRQKNIIDQSNDAITTNLENATPARLPPINTRDSETFTNQRFTLGKEFYSMDLDDDCHNIDPGTLQPKYSPDDILLKIFDVDLA